MPLLNKMSILLKSGIHFIAKSENIAKPKHVSEVSSSSQEFIT